MDVILISIIAMGLAYAMFSVLMQRKLSNIDKMYELRAHMNMKTKELISMSKSNNVPPAELMTRQRELNEITMQSMKNQMKPMIVILPVLAAIEYFVLPTLYSGASFSIVLLGFTLGYQTSFLVVVFVVGLLLSLSLSFMDRKRLKHKYDFGLLQPSLKQPPTEPNTQ